MDLFVKICGLCSASEVDAVAALGPDAIGFIFWPRSRRCVNAADVGAWVGGLPPRIRKVGVFVDAPPAEVRRVVAEARLDLVQLHGGEAASDYVDIGAPLWKAVHLDRLDERAPGPVDALLVDSYSSASPGGTGRVADWGRARAFVQTAPCPVILAGGLHLGNVAEGVRVVGPWGVDVSSGVEHRPGEKDLAKVGAFIARCRSL